MSSADIQHRSFARNGVFFMWPMQHTVRPVWPVEPARWGQASSHWVGELQVRLDSAPAPDCLVAVKLPDGRLVRYDLEALWRLPREWQPTPPEVPDYQI